MEMWPDYVYEPMAIVLLALNGRGVVNLRLKMEWKNLLVRMVRQDARPGLLPLALEDEGRPIKGCAPLVLSPDRQLSLA
jgi:hypothetical protein